MVDAVRDRSQCTVYGGQTHRGYADVRYVEWTSVCLGLTLQEDKRIT